MLFDLRSRRRRRVVKTVYLFLAVLIGLGLVGFGIGTGGNFGGILSAAGNGGGGSASGAAIYEKAMKKAQKRAAAHPSDSAAWVAVGTAAVNLSQLPTNYVANSGYTKAGYQVLKQLKNAWTRYLALAPSKLNAQLAASVASAFGPPPPDGTGIGDYPTAESAQEVVVQLDPTYAEFEYLAYYAYLAHEKSRGDLAGARAVALAPKASKKQVQQALITFQQQAGLIGATGSSGSTASTGSTGTSG
ncbi:MAG: hypothetical protein ACRDLP_08665 [Solirubrobacteraceae bacterium]